MTWSGSITTCAGHFFGDEASTRWQRRRLKRDLGERYRHIDADVRDTGRIDRLFRRLGTDVRLVVHTAAQPSHDWAATDPHTDFTVNANGTLNLLEATRRHAPDAVFIFTSTNKVYGDTPNRLPLVEHETRWEIDPGHPYADGIREDMPIDQTLHSVFGASKVAADVMVQEYGRYFGLRTVCFRGGCLTGPNHSPSKLHGFLAYLVKCAATGTPYTVFGYGGKQVRDNIHSHDLIRAFDHVFRAPAHGEVYNIGGGRFSNCSMLEAISLCDEIAGRPLRWKYTEANRNGRPRLVGQRRRQVLSPLPDVATHLRRAAHLPGDFRGNPHEPAARARAALAGAAGSDRGSRVMIDRGRHNILGVRIDAVDYDAAVGRIVAAARARRPLAVSALAVHGLMTGVLDAAHRYRLNRFDLLVPDGQPVRWALNWLHRAHLPDRVYGPELMLRVCRAAAEQGLPDLPPRRHNGPAGGAAREPGTSLSRTPNRRHAPVPFPATDRDRAG